jgi:5-methylcytosine-specific restriction endonuclease McrA
MAKHQRRYKLRRYGLTAADQRLMEDAQGGRCGICGSDEDLVVDHCHATGRVRGLLCWSCNVGLGHFTDDPVRLQAAIAWLAKQDDYRRVLPLPF